MASEKVERVPPAVALRQEIAKHRRSMMVAASGMGPVLEILDAYIVSTEGQLRELRARCDANSRRSDGIEAHISELEARK
jgi:hypothetical protein